MRREIWLIDNTLLEGRGGGTLAFLLAVLIVLEVVVVAVAVTAVVVAPAAAVV